MFLDVLEICEILDWRAESQGIADCCQASKKRTLHYVTEKLVIEIVREIDKEGQTFVEPQRTCCNGSSHG